MSTACEACLKRGALIAMLAPAIAGLLTPHQRTSGLLALSDDDLLEAIAGERRPEIERSLRGFQPAAARAALLAARCEAVCRHSGDYPDGLTNLHDPPNPLYLRGEHPRQPR